MAVGEDGPLLDPQLAEGVLARALSNGGEFAEIFAEARGGATMQLEESRVERAQTGTEAGAGVRVVSGATTYFAHVDGLAEQDLMRAAQAAAAGVRADAAEVCALRAAEPPRLQEISIAPATVPAERKADVLRLCDGAARGESDDVRQVSASYAESVRRVAVANSEGLHAVDRRTRVRLGVQVVARRGDRVETGFETHGGHRGFELMDGADEIARQAAGRALRMLDSSPAPAGEMPVVVGGGFGGVLFHEMTGHGLEADAVQKGASVYAGRVGEKVAPDFLTAYDDGSMPGEWGTNAIDDEGTSTQRTAVIEQGRLTSFLYDRLRARRDGRGSTGNGRRESFRHLPIPRMTNTFIDPGDASPEDLISEVASGFYAVSFAGGQVEPATGDFVFGVSEGYRIEGGRVTEPLRGATLIGNGLEALLRVDGLAGDFSMKTGFCGKAGQRVPVGTGQGHVRISRMTVGGTVVG